MDSRVAAVVAAIDKRPCADIQALARSVNLSPSRLRHLFHAEMSMSLCHYLKQQRLRRAAQLLEITFLSVKEISDASGFRDSSHFVREFRVAFGRPPGEYRRAATFDSK
jgi:AraC family transcriptional regulator of arabinose operon